MLRRLCRIAVLGAALAAASVSHAQLIIPGGSSSGSGATPGGSSGQLQFNNAGVLGGASGTTWDDTNRALTLTGATVTTSTPLLDLSQTWNAGGVAFSALELNVTDTASASGSLLLDLRVGGSSKFSVTKAGAVMSPSSIFGSSIIANTGGSLLSKSGAFAGVQLYASADGSAVLQNYAGTAFSVLALNTDSGISRLAAASLAIGNGTAGDYSGKLTLGSLYFGGTTGSIYVNGSLRADYGATTGSVWTFQGSTALSSDSMYYSLGAALDVRLYRDAANQLALRNGGSAQTFNVYNTYTDSSNYERGGLYWSGGAFTLGTQSAGTGGARAVQLISSSSVYVQTNGGSGPYWVFDTGGNLKAGVDGSYDIGVSGANRARNAYLAGKIVTGSTTLHETSVALANGAAAATGTLTNAPAAGNPTKWFPINDNGTTRYVPAW